jgi:hypothetical protein
VSALERLCKELKIECEARYGEVEVSDGWSAGTHPYKVTLRMRDRDGRRRLTVPFFMGSANTREPTAADVLNCLVSDARAGEMTFEEFCSDFGYDVDSRKAEKTWKACSANAPRVRRFLGEHFEAVEGAEH